MTMGEISFFQSPALLCHGSRTNYHRIRLLWLDAAVDNNLTLNFSSNGGTVQAPLFDLFDDQFGLSLSLSEELCRNCSKSGKSSNIVSLLLWVLVERGINCQT